MLIALKIKNRDLYKRYINLECEIFDVIDFLIPVNSRMDEAYIALVEIVIYRSYLPVPAFELKQTQKDIKNLLLKLSNNSEVFQTDIMTTRLRNALTNNKLGLYYTAAKNINRLEKDTNMEELRLISGILELASLSLKQDR